MFAVIFEVQPRAERWGEYLKLAGLLRPEIEKVPGFIDNERFNSLRTKGRLLSLSTWADEKAVVRWRTHGMHHGVQEKGRFEVFEDYHLRVGEIVADTHVPSGQRLAEQHLDTTEVGRAKVISITEIDPPMGSESEPFDQDRLGRLLRVPTAGQHGVIDAEVYSGINVKGKLALLVSWRDAGAAAAWQPPAGLDGANRLRHRRVRVIRDYGMNDRREAPQYYPEVARSGAHG